MLVRKARADNPLSQAWNKSSANIANLERLQKRASKTTGPFLTTSLAAVYLTHFRRLQAQLPISLFDGRTCSRQCYIR